MAITDVEMSLLMDSVAGKQANEIATAVFGIESVLREIISLIASHPERLKVCSVFGLLLTWHVCTATDNN